MTHPTVSLIWERYRRENPDVAEQPPFAFHFCDLREDANVCADLVVQGRKQATAASLKELELAGLEPARPGEHFIVTDFDGIAKAIIRTTSVDIRRFGDVDEEFARAEGEGDLTLGWWREAHRGYFARVLEGSGTPVDDDLLISCEHFETVFVPGEDGG